jgi:hypothetical protein
MGIKTEIPFAGGRSMSSRRLFLWLLVSAGSIGFALVVTAGPPSPPQQGGVRPPEEMQLSEVINELKGAWSGYGLSEEVRYRHPDELLILTVKHETQFFFHIGEDGSVEGDGTIVYRLERNTSGLDDLAAQVRGMIGMLPSAVPSVMGSVHRDITKDSLKGLNKIQYDAPHLKHGSELRQFEFTGRVARGMSKLKDLSKDRQDWHWPDEDVETKQKVLLLDPVINFTLPDGTPNSTLIAEWEVNGKREEKAFPCWSPFLKQPGVLRRGPNGVWLADFMEKGTHRDGKQMWQEYSYVWMSRQVQVDQQSK